MFLSLFGFACFCGILAVVFGVRKRYSYWKDLNIPYDKPTFPYGSLLLRKGQHLPGCLEKVYKKFQGKTPFVGLFLFMKPVAMILDLDLMKHILIRDFHNFSDRGVYYNETDDPLSANLISLHGEKWRLLRTKLAPTFTSGKMKYMFPTIVEVSKRLEKKIDEIINKNNEMNIKVIMSRFTIDVIGTCAFGIECNSINDPNCEFRLMAESIFSKPRHSTLFLLFILSFKNIARKFHVKIFRDNVTDFFTKIVRETLYQRELNDTRRNDFMDLLIALKNDQINEPITLNELTAQAFLFFNAGFETSSTLLSFCLYELAINPEIQEKARQHIKNILKKHNGQMTYEAMMDMKYLDQVLNETLRLYPPGSTLFRHAAQDYQVPGTDHILKKGTTVVIPVFAIHRNPEIYPNPEVFNPENFTEEKCNERPSVAFLSFGEGPRGCIAKRFGLMEARIGLISVLSNFQLELSSKTKIPVKVTVKSFILTPEEGIWLKLTRIKE